MRKWISGYIDNTRRLWKTTKYCRREKEYIKESLMIYLCYNLGLSSNYNLGKDLRKNEK